MKGWSTVLWFIGLMSVGFAMATIGIESERHDDERDPEDEDFRDNSSDDEAEEDVRDVPGDPEGKPEDGAETSGSHTAEGTSGKDLIFSEGADGGYFSEVHGNDGNDRIYASNGAEVFGGGGNDMIVLRNLDGESRPLEVSGDEGEDAFLVEAGDLSPQMHHVDTIVDYHPGEDILGVVLEDQNFSDGQVDGSVHFSLKDIKAEAREGGTLLTISICRELDPDNDNAGDESTTDLIHHVFLKGVQYFDPDDVIIVNDSIAFSRELLGPEGYASVVSPEK